MSVSRVFGVFAIVCCAASFGAANIRAQGQPEWMRVGNNVSGNAIYFFDAIHGIIANGGTLLYLKPSGLTRGRWYNANMPAGITYIRQIRFIQGELYATSKGTDVLVSSDSGRSWQFSGLGLVNANDVYADGSGNLRMLQDPMKVFARLDTLHCIAQGTGNIFVSSDGGLNWVSSGVPMVDSNSTGAFADPCYNVYVCPNSWGTAFRSNDFGQTWQSVNTGSGVGSEWLYGASTVPYITSSYGLFRSTNDGLTWYSVITVNSGPNVMYVWGPMGEHVALSAGVIWMTTTGGLDDLHGAPSMTDSNGMPLVQQDTFNVPLELASTCQPFAIPVTIESDVDSMSARLWIGKDSLGDFALAGTDTTIPLRRGHEDTVWLFYQPHHPVANVVLTFENHWHCSDWTETRTVHVDAIPKALITMPVFTAGCIADTEAALIQLDSCQTLCIDSIVIPASITANFRLTTLLPDTASIGRNDSLLFAFLSSSVNDTVSDSVRIYAHYLGLDSILDDYFYFPHASGVDTDFSLFYTTLPVTLHSLPNGRVLSANASPLRVDTLSICEERDTFAVIRNIGCDTVCISNISLSGTGFRITDGQRATRCLPTGERDTVWLQTLTDTAGHPLANSDTLLVSSDAQPPLAPVILSEVIQYPVAWGLSLSQPDSANAGQTVVYKIIQHGLLPPDDTSVDFQLVFYDDLLTVDTVDESSLHVLGYYRDANGMAHYHFHVTMPVADSFLATIHFSAYQARLLSTQLSLDSVRFSSNLSRPSDCIASAALANSEFTIRTSCSGPLLSEALGGLLVIDGISPNPTMGEVSLHYTLHGAPLAATIELEDALGRTVLEQTTLLSTGSHQSIVLDLSALPSGMYLSRIVASGEHRDRWICPTLIIRQ